MGLSANVKEQNDIGKTYCATGQTYDI